MGDKGGLDLKLAQGMCTGTIVQEELAVSYR